MRFVLGFTGTGDGLVVVGVYERFVSSLRASSSSIYRARMASALSTGSCVGLDFVSVRTGVG